MELNLCDVGRLNVQTFKFETINQSKFCSKYIFKEIFQILVSVGTSSFSHIGLHNLRALFKVINSVISLLPILHNDRSPEKYFFYNSSWPKLRLSGSRSHQRPLIFQFQQTLKIHWTTFNPLLYPLSCCQLDIIPTFLLKEVLEAVDSTILSIINNCIVSGFVPSCI